MKIQVLGSGCATCKKLYEITQKAVSEMGLKEKVEYLSGAKGTQGIIEMGIMQSPVLAVNGNPVMIGFTPDIEKIKKGIASGIKTEEKSSQCSCGGKCS
ncbi:MAG: thioredoxin family protein [bacterium]